MNIKSETDQNSLFFVVVKHMLQSKEELQTELEALDNSDVDEAFSKARSVSAEGTKPKRRIQIYFQNDFSSLSAELQNAAIEAFAAVMGISPKAVKVYRVDEG